MTTRDETIVWQMMPRGSGSQTFDFQATSAGWLAIYNPVPAYIQACIRKEDGSPVIAHMERHFFPRRRGIESGRKVILAHFPQGGLTLEQTRDDWSDVFDTVNDLWRAHYNYPADNEDTAYSPTMWAGVMDYNSGWADYFAERVLAIKEECGIDGIFIDSYHNLNFQPINYADPEIKTNMPGLIAWQRRMRKAGLGIMMETQGIFGTSVNWLDRGAVKTEGNGGVEHTFYKSMVCIKTEWIESGRIDEAFCYRATANKAPIRLETDFWNLDEVALPTHVWDGFFSRINHDYYAVRDRMIRRRTLDRDRGVEWLNDDRSHVLALFSFADSAYTPPPGSRLYDVTDGREVEVIDGVANVRRFHTYRVD